FGLDDEEARQEQRPDEQARHRGHDLERITLLRAVDQQRDAAGQEQDLEREQPGSGKGLGLGLLGRIAGLHVGSSKGLRVELSYRHDITTESRRGSFPPFRYKHVTPYVAKLC